MFHGVQERFVNTSTGNLTFLVRDLVAVGAMPIVAGRVYDSALEKSDDFGPGWKLTLREEIVRSGSRLAFTDASNSTYALEIDGSAVKPVHVASTPVRSGELIAGGNAIVLRSPGLTRRFDAIDGVYRLVQAAHASGSVRLGYRNGLIENATSNTATVRFERRADGRIVAVRDNLGRTAAYAYDDAGRLVDAQDLAGAIWRYRYAAGGLAAVADPRGRTTLHATYDAQGRVSWIEAQGGKSAFAYRQTTTRAVDGLSRTTVFHRSKPGITEGVASPTGAFSQLAFDAAGRPVEVLRDGVKVASLGYDAEGRLASMRHANGATRFAHGAHGLSRAAGAETASYGYDADGRLLSAADADGRRSYGYDAAGFPSRIEIDTWKTTLGHDANGQTTRVSRAGRTLVEYAYRPDGRVASIAHGDKAGTAAYAYDRRGLRETASYGGGVASAMHYDATGNLVRYAVEAPGGKHSQEYELGGYNQVLSIRNGGNAAGPDLTFRYDGAGRAFAMQAGDRTSTASYDALDRATRLTLDGEAIVDYAYGPLDEGAVAAADRRTGETLAPFALSPVFGTMDSVFHARPRPAAHGAVAYSPALKTFEATWRHLVPDALALAGLRRRDLPVRGETPDPAPFAHDRPSNSLFLPLEYRAVNCHVCSSSVQRVSFSIGSATAGHSVNVGIRIGGTCSAILSSVGAFGIYPQGGSWQHRLSYGDGTPVERFSTAGADARRSHVYPRAGVFEARDEVECQACSSPVAIGEGTVTVVVADDEPCDPGLPPPYEHPIPAVEVLNATILEGRVAGLASISIDEDKLTCAEICANKTYRIQGNAITDAWAYATTRIEPVGDCTAGRRGPARMASIVAHENHHISTLVRELNDVQIRIDHRTMASCQSRLMSMKSATRRTYRTELENQRCHRDPYFRNEYVHAVYCPPPKNKDAPEARRSQEVVTTQPIYRRCGGI